MNYLEFSKSIKLKYPQYEDVDDKVLAEKMIVKYPEYSDRVEFGDQPDSISGGVAALAGVASQPERLQAIAQDPLQELKTAGQVVGTAGLEAAQVAGGLAFPFVSGVSTTPLTQFGIEKIAGKPTPEAIKTSLSAGAGDLAFSLATGGLGGGLRKILPKTAKIAAGIPEESTLRALSKEKIGKGIFKGKFEPKKQFQELGEKAQKGLEYIQKESGKAVGAEKEALKNITDKFDFSDIIKNMETLKAEKQFGRETVLSRLDVSKINNISNKLKLLNKGGMEIGELYAVKKQIDDLVKFDPSLIKKVSGEGQGLLKQAGRLIDDKISNISPKYKKVAAKYSNIRHIYDKILPRIKERTAGTNLKNIFKKELMKPDESVRFIHELEELDNLLPKKYKFVDKLKTTLAREQFEQILPSGSLGSGMARGLAISGLGIYGGGSLPMLAGAGGLAAAMSPKTYKQLIKTVGKPMSPTLRTLGKQASQKGATQLKISELLGLKGE